MERENYTDVRGAILSVIINRYFSEDAVDRRVTVREIRNDLEKDMGIRLTQRQVRRYVKDIEEKGAIERKRSPKRGLGRTTVVYLRKDRVKRRLVGTVGLDERREKVFARTIDRGKRYDGILNDPPIGQTIFLAIDRVEYKEVSLPLIGFKAKVLLNYRFPCPMEILLIGKLRGTDKILGLAQKVLRGNGVEMVELDIQPPGFDRSVERYRWKLKIDVYVRNPLVKNGRNDKEPWHHSDSFICRRSIRAPSIKPLGGGLYNVESFTKRGKFYVVNLPHGTCTCPAFRFFRGKCKHLRALDLIAEVISRRMRARLNGQSTPRENNRLIMIQEPREIREPESDGKRTIQSNRTNAAEKDKLKALNGSFNRLHQLTEQLNRLAEKFNHRTTLSSIGSKEPDKQERN